MNISLCLLGIFLQVLRNTCEAKVLVTYRVADEIEKVYAERKKYDRHLAHIASLTQNERLAACRFYRAGDYDDDEESKPHMYEVEMPDEAIPEDEKGEAGSPEVESSRTVAKAKRPIDVDTEEGVDVEPKLKQLKLKDAEREWRGLKKEDDEIAEPKMIYNLDIAFRCHTENADEKDFILSYGFAREMFFVSEPVGELDEENPFSGRKLKLTGYMFAPPISENTTPNILNKKYFELRKRAEKVWQQSPTLMEDIEKHDDISALTFREKNILCASIVETGHYKGQGYRYLPIDDPADFEYVKYPVGAFNHETAEYETFDTDFLECKARKATFGVETIGVTRSYAEGGIVFTSTIKKNVKKQFLDAEITKIAVLNNRKYAGEREGVLEVLEAIKAN